MKALAALALLILSGCASMPDQKVSGIDNLTVEKYVVEPGEVFTICAPLLGGYAKSVLMLPMACAIVNLEQKKCVIIVAANSTPDTIEHEEMHCKGYAHDNSLIVYRDAWRSNKERDL